MRQKNPILSIALILAFAWSASGCQGTVQRHSFPADWPAGLNWSRPAAAKTAPHRASAPLVAVEPFTLDVEDGVRPSGRGPGTTSRMLTRLMIEKLKQAGIRVSEEAAVYVLRGTVPRLGYTERGGYPRRFYYTSELVYQLVHRPSGTVVWKGDLSQDFEQTVLVNTMTRLPSDPEAPERVLLDQCVGPTWEAIASDVGAFLKKHGQQPP